MSTSGMVAEIPRARPTHTPISTGEGTDAERQEETSPGGTIEQMAAPVLPQEDISPEEQLMTGDPATDIEALIYLDYPELMTAQELIGPVMTRFVEKLGSAKSTVEEDKEMEEFASSCFNETYDQLVNRMEPVEDGVQEALGNANDAFPYLLPKVFNQYRDICRQMAERQQAASQPVEEEQEEEAEEDSGNSIPEFTQVLISSLEESTSKEPWDTELRNTLRNQLIEFLNQSTSTDPGYLVKEYERHLQQLINAQNQRLRVKYADDKKGMLRESGAIKRIISKIPDVAREVFKTHVYNPDKKVRMEDICDEAEYEEEGWEEEVQQTSAPKRPCSSIAPRRLRKQLSQSQRHHIEIQNRK